MSFKIEDFKIGDILIVDINETYDKQKNQRAKVTRMWKESIEICTFGRVPNYDDGNFYYLYQSFMNEDSAPVKVVEVIDKTKFKFAKKAGKTTKKFLNITTYEEFYGKMISKNKFKIGPATILFKNNGESLFGIYRALEN